MQVFRPWWMWIHLDKKGESKQTQNHDLEFPDSPALLEVRLVAKLHQPLSI